MDATTVIRIIAGILFIVVFFAMIPPYWMIFKKAGFSPWLSLLMYIPLVNIIVLYVVGFSDWKAPPASQYLTAADFYTWNLMRSCHNMPQHKSWDAALCRLNAPPALPL